MNTASSPVADLLKSSIFDRLSDRRFALQFGSAYLSIDIALRVFHENSVTNAHLGIGDISVGLIILYVAASLVFHAYLVSHIRSLARSILSPVLTYIERHTERPALGDDWVSCGEAETYAWANKDEMLLKAAREEWNRALRINDNNDLSFGFGSLVLISLWMKGPIFGWSWIMAQPADVVLATRIVLSIASGWMVVDSLRYLSDYAFCVQIPGHPLVVAKTAAKEKARQEMIDRSITRVRDPII